MLVGPGGAGKGTVASRLVERDPHLRLSRSWTTRPPRPGERPDAYHFVTREQFEERIATGGFLEWAEFLGSLYGTPWPVEDGCADLLLEIDVQGAEQVRRSRPDATVVLLLPPSPEAHAARLRRRGDPEERIRLRLAKGVEEERMGRQLADHVVVNDDLERAVGEVAAIVEASRGASSRPQHDPGAG